MKKITRKNGPTILKRKIDLKNLIPYETIDIDLEKLIDEVVTTTIYSTVDLLKLLKENYQGNFKKAIEDIQDYSSVRFNCYYAAKLLKEKLEERNIKTNYISYKSVEFSSKSGDKLMKEAHIALLLPTKKENKIYYLILDPGLKIPKPIGFYQKDKKTEIKIDCDIIKIVKRRYKKYPYRIEVQGYNRYSLNEKIQQCTDFLDIRFETINPSEILFPMSYQVLEGYRIIHYPKNKNNFASLKIMLIKKYIEIIEGDNKTILSFEKIKKMNLSTLEEALKNLSIKLSEEKEELAKLILFYVNHLDEFLSTVIEKSVYKEKIKQQKILPEQEKYLDKKKKETFNRFPFLTRIII